MTVIAMTREMGTRGKDVAAVLADTLGIEVVHHELVERHLAERLHTNESAVHRFLEGKTSLWERWNVDAKRLSRFSAEEVLELAAKGNVIIRGWGAAKLLADVQHVICVRIYDRMANRTTEMMRRLEIRDESVARHEIERNDDAHARTIQRQFGKDWRDPSSYDMILNSGRMPIDACVRQIRLLADNPAYEETDQSRAKLQDKLIEARVRTLLDEVIAATPYGNGLRVDAKEGVVTLSGVLTDKDSAKAITSKVSSVKGIVSVNNDVHVVKLEYGV
jgi:cytidylate kinase